ncbi:hypothetical protein U3516DRAFT_87258 [Neocallimastix sp. 'constans']
MSESNRNHGFLEDIYLITDQLQDYDNKENTIRANNYLHDYERNKNKNRNGNKSINYGKSLSNSNIMISNNRKLIPRQPYSTSYINTMKQTKSNKNNGIFNTEKRSMKEIKQFCKDIKNSKKLNVIHSTQSFFNNYDSIDKPQPTETILLNESEELVETFNDDYSDYSSKNDNSNYMNYLLLEKFNLLNTYFNFLIKEKKALICYTNK